MFNLLVSGRLAKVALIFVSLAHAHGYINKELRSEPPPSKSLRSSKNLALLASDSALADKASASETLYFIITAGQRPAVVIRTALRPRRGRTILQRLT